MRDVHGAQRMTVRSILVLAAFSVGATACNDTQFLAEGEPSETPPATPVPTPEADPAGCADGTREGFLSQGPYPDIAACAGAWSVPGVGQIVAPACGRDGGNDSGHPEGEGCSAADLCAEGWHICRGFTEVALHAPSGCADAVPGSSAAGSLFAIAQRSDSNMICDESASDMNDVFGCGSLGMSLSSTQNCGPLTAALASMQPGSCGWNQAMPPLGPWECQGSNSFDEGAFVTKKGCPGGSCSYDGHPVGSSDGGGVLCCRD